MAATCFSLTQPSSGFNKLNDYIQIQSHFNRFHLGSNRSTFSVHKVFHRRYRGQLQVQRWHQYLNVHCARGAELSSSSFEDVREEIQEEISKETLIWRAIKLPIYSVALVPLTVGSAAAYLQTGIFSARCYFVLLASSVLVITWLNLSNDVYDFDTGVDKNKKESIVNLVGSRTGTFIAAYLCLALGFIGLTWVAVMAGNMRSILFLICAIICGYIYQCPPFRLSYQGLGEPLCFAAFGPFATSAFYLLQGSPSVMNHFPLSGTVLSASILVGFTTSLILLCSHFHQ
ncbi:UbiA prenyltransferase family, partial [Sesbania bispinosa]